MIKTGKGQIKPHGLDSVLICFGTPTARPIPAMHTNPVVDLQIAHRTALGDACSSPPKRSVGSRSSDQV